MIVNEYISYLERVNKSPNTVRGHKATLKLFVEAVGDDLNNLIPRDIEKYQASLVEAGKTAGTINTHVKRLKVFFKWLETSGIIQEDISKEVKIKREITTSVRWLSEPQITLLLREANWRFKDRGKIREYTIIRTLLGTGLRVEELCNLQRSDVVINKRFIRVRDGKGGAYREVSINEKLAAVLKAYTEGYTPKGNFFFDTNRSDKMTTRAVNHLLAKFNGVSDSKGRVTIEKLHAHMLRHTYAKSLVRVGEPLESIAKLLGHERNDGTPNIQMTARYVKASQEELSESVNKLDF
ncbi:tyrosine-type recombinase/integrase [Metabacillus sp. FJAT-52054]|uniref:Tyrosine-type recombinase/integrase n=1 Tax=Metabacillus sediminis TaxID=3117746 RepID=A0ABZ2NIA6_9BACI